MMNGEFQASKTSRTELEEWMRLQLSEVEMIGSMLSNPGEFVVEDPSIEIDMNDFLDGKTDQLPVQMNFIMNLQFEKGSLKVAVTLPHDYPASEPDIFIRGDTLDRDSQHQINEDVSSFVEESARDELIMGSVVFWLQENGDKYLQGVGSVRPKTVKRKPSGPVPSNMFTRHWIYAHHIYCTNKRREMLSLAKDLELTGFCLAGKPGLVCIEGIANNCDEWYSTIKAMGWQKIMCRKIEELPITAAAPVDSLRRFGKFEELATSTTVRYGRHFHQDMGEFLKYLEEHQSGYAFKEYFFGVDSQSSSANAQ